MAIVRLTLRINHDATDPTDNDSTLDLTHLLVERLNLTNIDTVERGEQYILLCANIDVADPARFRIEP